ncbi:M28 family peptidase [Nafulsella turpanensis]|uniref:M28 family peptidase n=1 Tax=Nafulsella turpanensis TaxID=1265690 RepID=UPI0003491241|nr:M28 family peptidase [Nafulsella turpanensis]
MQLSYKSFFGALALSAALLSCNNDGPSQEAVEAPAEPTVAKLEGVEVPSFDADSAYSYVDKQVNFGPRVPNTPEHREAGDYLVRKLEEFGAEVKVQEFEATAFDGTVLQLRNIIGSYKPEAQKRVLLAAHWDTRPFADKEEDESLHNQPIAGANDGGSGVAVLLEIARLINQNEGPQVGVDIIFFDGEDYGEPEFLPMEDREPNRTYWCLGSQYWAENKHVPNYTAYFGILLDMVGAENAQFWREGYSREYAPSVLKRVWAWGHELGYSRYFKYSNSEAIIDDHVFMNRAGVPSIDIIDYDPASDFYFGDYHHTLKDDMGIISKETLKAVGETVLHTIYHEPGAGA